MHRIHQTFATSLRNVVRSLRPQFNGWTYVCYKLSKDLFGTSNLERRHIVSFVSGPFCASETNKCSLMLYAVSRANFSIIKLVRGKFKELAATSRVSAKLGVVLPGFVFWQNAWTEKFPQSNALGRPISIPHNIYLLHELLTKHNQMVFQWGIEVKMYEAPDATTVDFARNRGWPSPRRCGVVSLCSTAADSNIRRLSGLALALPKW